MSILIKGINIPKCSNEDCIVVIRHDKAEVWQTGYKERTVEAIQIDRPHGRLIDGDELKTLFKGDAELDTYTAFHFLYAIDEAPTIIEAEE